METIVIAADRGNTLTSGTTLLVVSVVVAAAAVFVLFKHLRNRQQPGA